MPSSAISSALPPSSAFLPLQAGQRGTPTAYKRYNKGGCIVIADLAPSQLYTFSVQVGGSRRGIELQL